jgi:hypothetical protein
VGVVVTVTAEPYMPLVVALHPAEPPLAVFVVEMPAFNRKEDVTLLASLAGAATALDAGFLLF